jgi:hypothetical protein
MRVPLIRPLGLNNTLYIEQLYSELINAIDGGRARSRLEIDLSQVSFITPEGIIALISCARLWYLVTGQVANLFNSSVEVHRYLERMDLFEQCGSWLETKQSLPEWNRLSRSAASQNLLEVLPVASEEMQNAQDVTAALARAARIVESWFTADMIAVGRLLTILSEITSNVTHSLDRGFAVIQRYRDKDVGTLGSQVTIAVGDLGIGIEASLRKKGISHSNISSNWQGTGSDYILAAMQLGVTSRSTVGGMGLYQVSTLVHDWQGSLAIRSRRSRVRIAADGVEPRNDLAEIPGTQVVIRIGGPFAGI